MKQMRGSGASVLLSVLVVAFLLATSSVLGEDGSGKPELHPTTLVLEPSSPVEQGQLVKVLANLENSGPASADGFKVEFFVRLRPGDEGSARSWTSFAIVEVAGLSPGAQEIQVGAELDTSDPELIPSADVFEVRAVVDSNDQIPELDETNNELVTSVLVRPSKLGKPDLRPRSLVFEPPSPVGQDDTVVTEAVVVNTGDLNAGPFPVTFSHCRVSQGQSSCGGEFVELDRRRLEGGLPRGSTRHIETTIAIADLGLAPGRYLIKIAVDPPDADHPVGQVEEQDDANNELIAALFIQGPELHPTSVSFDPAIPHLGEPVKVTAGVKNSGEGVAHKVAVAFFVDGARFALRTRPVEEDEEVGVHAFLKSDELNLSPGVHAVRIVIDPANQIAERDETNNEIRTSLTFQPPVPRKAELRPKRLVFNPSSPVELGSNPSLTVLAEVLNTGQIEATDVAVAFSYRLVGSLRWNELPCVTNCTIAQLPAGARVEAKGDLDLVGLLPGRYEVRVVVDPGVDGSPAGAIEELDEFNNEMRSSITLLAARVPDLLVDPRTVTFEPSLELRRGTPVRLTLDVLNDGERASGAFTVEFSVRRIDEETFTVFERRTVEGLGLGERAGLGAVLQTDFLRPGFYEVQVLVDPEDRINEADEDNNLFTTGVNPEIGQPLFLRGTDLSVVGLDFADPTISFLAPQVTQGERMEVSAEVVNRGIEATGSFRVEFCVQRVGESRCLPFEAPVDMRDRERIEFPGLGVGVAVRARTFLDTGALEPGEFEIRAVADAADRVDEENELNNTASLSLEVLPQPDLEVSRIVFAPPSPVEPGSPVTVFADVINRGAGRTRLPFAVAFGLGGPAEGECAPFTMVQVAGLPSGEQAVVKAQLPPVLQNPGSHEICVSVDPQNAIPEPDEGNNFAAAGLIVGIPDLLVKTITFDPAPPFVAGEAEEIKLFADIRNEGEGPVVEPFEVEFALRRVGPEAEERPFRTVARVTHVGLEPGAQVAAKAELDAAELIPGAYEVRVTVDPEDGIIERDETNNLATARLIVGAPDLVVKTVTFDPSPPFVAGQIGEVKLFADIRNQGVGPVLEPFEVEFALRRVEPKPEESEFRLLRRVTLPGLEPGAQAAAKMELDASDLIAGRYELRVTVDPRDALAEGSEANNQLVAPFRIIPEGEGKADLTVLELELSPEKAFVGQKVEVRAKIGNIGPADAGPFRVVFFWRRLGHDRLVNFAHFQLGGLPRGAQRVLTSQLDTSLMWRGRFEIIAVVDFNEQVEELDEDNNRKRERLTVK